MSRSLESLAPQEVVALAIHIERANARRLRAFADVFRGYDPEVAMRFEELANEEVGHEAILASRFAELCGDPIPDIDETAVSEVIESFDLPDSECLVFDSLDPRGVLELALRAERHAREFYRQAAAAATDVRFRTLYEELLSMEGGHVAWLEAKIDEARDD